MSAQGFYSLIQYSEVPDRMEFVNVGIVLFSERAPRVLVKFSESPRRVERVFRVNLGIHYRLLMESIESRIYHDFKENWDSRNLERFILLRSGKVRLSASKSVAVSDAQETIAQLYKDLVGDTDTRSREPRARSKLKRELSHIGVEGLLERPEPVSLPQGVVIKAPYAFQNGSYNLITAISLRQEPDLAIEVAGKHAIEGNWLHEATRLDSPKKLIVVGDTQGQNEDFTRAVAEVMRENQVKFYSMEDLEPLALDIKHAAALHS
jgi:hypothetical protein